MPCSMLTSVCQILKCFLLEHFIQQKPLISEVYKTGEWPSRRSKNFYNRLTNSFEISSVTGSNKIKFLEKLRMESFVFTKIVFFDFITSIRDDNIITKLPFLCYTVSPWIACIFLQEIFNLWILMGIELCPFAN